MPTLNFSFDTGNVPLTRIVDAIAKEYNYSATIFDPQNQGQTIPNPETKAVFARRMIGQLIKNIVKNQEISAARIVADASVAPINLD